jgi:PIN domain nuclease of toxin-antitoxin system
LNDRLLLDTHVWLWIFLGARRIKGVVRERLVASAESNELFIAAISMYEVGAGAKRGRIELNMATQAWFDLALVDPGLRLLALTPEIASETAVLPDDFHGDPGDRLVAATARVHNLVLCTHDEKLLRFGQQGVYKFLEV